MKLYLFVSSSLQLQSCRNLRACKRMPPADGRLSVPRSRDGTGLQLLWSRLLQPPTRCRLWEVLKIARVDLLNRFNNSAYKLNLLLGYFFFLSLPSFLPSSGASVIQLARHPSRVIQSRGSVCVVREWRGDCVILAVRASLDSRHEAAEVQDFTSGIASALPSDPLMHLTQITHEGISDSSMFTSAAPPPLPSSRPPIHLCPCVVLQPVTATQWAPFPCSVTATGPATVAMALWVISVTNVSWTISTTERRTSARSAPFAMALLRSRWVCVCLWLMSVEGVLKFCLLSLQTCNYCEHNTEISHHHNYCLLHI